MNRAAGHRAVLLGLLVGALFGWAARDWAARGKVASVAAALDSAESKADSLRWLLTTRPRDLRVERDSIVARTARSMGMDPGLALAVAWVENAPADSEAVSPAGAAGLMQVMTPAAFEARGNPAAAVERARLIERLCGDAARILERGCNVRVGLTIYKEYLRRHDGDEYRALAAYNGALSYPRAAAAYVSAVRAFLESVN